MEWLKVLGKVLALVLEALGLIKDLAELWQLLQKLL